MGIKNISLWENEIYGKNKQFKKIKNCNNFIKIFLFHIILFKFIQFNIFIQKIMINYY